MPAVRRLITTFNPSHYELSLDIDRPKRMFKGTVSIDGVSSYDHIRVHAKDLVITKTIVDGHLASFAPDENDEIIVRYDGLKAGRHVVVIEFNGRITDQMHGMYPCYFSHDDKPKELIATQFESHHAREVFPCVDEPEAKATFDVTLTTEQDVTVLGNMPVKTQSNEGDRLVTKFEKTPKMSSYLLAWVYGELQSVSAQTKGDVTVNIWATSAQPARSLNYALDLAVRVIDFFDEYFGVKYPLPKSDHVALPDFSSGAMENWGLITYREVALLADPETTSIAGKRRIAEVIAHELSHQWFGNLVTMKWWNNLWLNESFATMMAYLAIDKLHPEWDFWSEFNAYDTVMALRRDAIDGVQPVQVEVNHPDEISTLFDPAIVYAKGAQLMRMLQRYVGDEAFQKALAGYVTRFAYQNTEETDLWNSIAEASGKDIPGLMTSWISRPGYPVVHVDESGLRQEQFFVGHHAQSDRVWPIPLDSEPSSLPDIFDTPTLAQPIAKARLNKSGSGHFITHYDPPLLAGLLDSIKDGSVDATGRLQLLNEQILLARGNVIESAALIPLLEAYKDETAESVWDLIGSTVGELKKFVEGDDASEAALKNLAGSLARAQYNRLGWDGVQDEPETDTKLRATIIGLMVYSEDADIIREAKARFDVKSLSSLNPELRPLIISAVVRHADNSDTFSALVELHKSTSSAELKQDICAGLTSAKRPEEIAKLLEIMKQPTIVRSQDVARWFVYLIRNRYARESAWQWMKDNWSWIVSVFGGDKSFDDYPRYSASGLVTRPQLEDYKAFFLPKKDIVALARVISMGISEIESRVELIERDGPSVRSALVNK